MRTTTATHVDQAIFSSAQTSTHQGYQILAASPGVTASEAEQLAAWSPSHDALLPFQEDGSLNFFRCRNRYCVSRTVAAGAEYSGRVGPRVYTHCFVLDADTLARFANNAFAVWSALAVAGRFQVYDHVPRELASVPLLGRASPLDEELVWRLLATLGPAGLVSLVDAAMREPRLALCGQANLALVFAALINLLPVEDRLELTFSTGLRPSPRRPFRLLVAPENVTEQRILSLRMEARVLHLAKLPPPVLPRHAWVQRVEEALASGQLRSLMGS